MIALAISAIILMLGIIYIDVFRHGSQVSTMQLEDIQAEFFARGIQNIGLLKIKRFPDFFLRSYRHSVYQARFDAGDIGVDAPLFGFPDPSPYERFLGVYAGRDNDVLNNISAADDTSWGFTEPLNIASYTTDINLVTSEDFTHGYIELTVMVLIEGSNASKIYRFSVASEQVAR